MVEKTPDPAIDPSVLASEPGKSFTPVGGKLGKTTAPVHILPSLVFEMPSQSLGGEDQATATNE